MRPHAHTVLALHTFGPLRTASCSVKQPLSQRSHTDSWMRTGSELLLAQTPQRQGQRLPPSRSGPARPVLEFRVR